MHDTVNLERAGIPTVVIAHDTFANAARFQALGMGLPSVRLISIPVPHPGENTKALESKMENIFNQIVCLLTK